MPVIFSSQLLSLRSLCPPIDQPWYISPVAFGQLHRPSYIAQACVPLHHLTGTFWWPRFQKLNPYHRSCPDFCKIFVSTVHHVDPNYWNIGWVMTYWNPASSIMISVVFVPAWCIPPSYTSCISKSLHHSSTQDYWTIILEINLRFGLSDT